MNRYRLNESPKPRLPPEWDAIFECKTCSLPVYFKYSPIVIPEVRFPILSWVMDWFKDPPKPPIYYPVYLTCDIGHCHPYGKAGDE